MTKKKNEDLSFSLYSQVNTMGEVSILRFLLSIFASGVALAKLLCDLTLIWLTLGWKVRRARKAFEKELIKQGMAKTDARRISAQFAALKENVENAFKRSLMSAHRPNVLINLRTTQGRKADL